MLLNLKNVEIKAEVDGIEIEGYGSYANRDYIGITMSKPFNGVKGGDGWHRPYFNPVKITDDQIEQPSKQSLIVIYKECLKIISKKEDIQQIIFDAQAEKAILNQRLEEMLKSRRLIKNKFKNGELTQGEYQQLANNINNEKFCLQKSIDNCFKYLYEKKFGESNIKNLEEAVQIIIDYSNKKDAEKFNINLSDSRLKEFIEDNLENADYMKYQMVSFSPNDTNLPMKVFVDDGGIDDIFRNYKPRIRFCNNHGKDFAYKNTLSMTIDKENPIVYPDHLDKLKLSSEDILSLKRWVKLNYDVLIRLWTHNYTNGSKIQTIKSLKKLIKIIEIEGEFDADKAKSESLYVVDIKIHEGTYTEQFGNLFYGTEIKSDHEYCCSKRFIAVDNDRETALRTLQNGLEQYKKEYDNCFNSQLNVYESDVEVFSKSYGGCLTYIEDDCTFFTFTVEYYNSRNFAIFDI